MKNELDFFLGTRGGADEQGLSLAIFRCLASLRPINGFVRRNMRCDVDSDLTVKCILDADCVTPKDQNLCRTLMY